MPNPSGKLLKRSFRCFTVSFQKLMKNLAPVWFPWISISSWRKMKFLTNFPFVKIGVSFKIIVLDPIPKIPHNFLPTQGNYCLLRTAISPPKSTSTPPAARLGSPVLPSSAGSDGSADCKNARCASVPEGDTAHVRRRTPFGFFTKSILNRT